MNKMNTVQKIIELYNKYFEKFSLLKIFKIKNKLIEPIPQIIKKLFPSVKFTSELKNKPIN